MPIDDPLLVYVLVLLALVAIDLARHRAREREGEQRLREAVEAGLNEPASLHPVIDPARCLNSRACVAACPENAIGIIEGRAQLVNAARGVMEAKDAIARTQEEGFRRGSVIFLDIERMQATPQKMREYYRAWTAHVLADGRYRPGFYAHTHNAALIHRDVKSVYVAAGIDAEPPFWIAGGRDFTPDKQPHEVGHAFAAVWQGALDVVQEWKGHRLPLDVNVAQVRDPSLQYVATD